MIRSVFLVVCLAVTACGGTPEEITEIAEKPSKGDLKTFCSVYSAQKASLTDGSAESGFREMARMGVSEEDIKKVRKIREEGRKPYEQGLDECCNALNSSAGDMSKTQIAYVYGDLVTGFIKDLTPAQRRAATDVRNAAFDNLKQSEYVAAGRIGGELRRCERTVSQQVSRETSSQISEVLKAYR